MTQNETSFVIWNTAGPKSSDADGERGLHGGFNKQEIIQIEIIRGYFSVVSVCCDKHRCEKEEKQNFFGWSEVNFIVL